MPRARRIPLSFAFASTRIEMCSWTFASHMRPCCDYRLLIASLAGRAFGQGGRQGSSVCSGLIDDGFFIQARKGLRLGKRRRRARAH